MPAGARRAGGVPAAARPRPRRTVLAAFATACAWAPRVGEGASLALPGSRELGDATCDMDTVQGANIHQLHPILHDLVNTTFFRLFRVSVAPACPFWQKAPAEEEEHAGGSTCSGGGEGFGSTFLGFGAGPADPPEVPCSIDSEEPTSGASGGDLALDMSMTVAEQIASSTRDNQSESECEFEEDLPTYWVDMISCDSTKGGELEDVNLIKNPERNTGYNGSHIWEAMYQENCFEVGSSLPRGRFAATQEENGMCYEERVLYRLLSGWHASTTLSVVKSFYAPGTKEKGAWAPNLDRFMADIGQHPERVKNLHFSFVVMLRAVKKAAPFLQTYPYATGSMRDDNQTKSLVNRLLDSQVLSLCSPLFDAFDETRLFRDSASSQQRSQLKRQFKSVFQNITLLVDCVQCQRCRLHAKVFSLGLGSALKILLTPPHLIAMSTSRDEVVAMVHTLWKLSEAMEDARVLTQRYYQERETMTRPSPTPGAAATAAAAPPRVAAPPPPAHADGLGGGSRLELLDAALGAVRAAAQGGALSAAEELEVLRSLVVRPASDEVLLLARHYAVARPELFVALAREAAATAPAAAVLPVGPLGSPETPADAVVVGGGLAGMVATLTLLDRGARVVLVDKQPYLGGNSGKASSGINAALDTTVESLVSDTARSAGALGREALIEKLATDSAGAVSWLRERTGVDLSMRSQLGGHTAKRTLRPSNAFVGAEITFAAGEILKKAAAESPSHFRMLAKAKLTGAAQGGHGWRATVQANGTEAVLEGTALVIASGGFGHDSKEAESLLLMHRPDLAAFPTTLGAQTTGDGVKIARDLGARLVDMDRVQLHPTGFVDPQRPQENTKTLGAELLRGVGGLLLDRHGRRFTDELGTRQAVVDAELEAAKAGLDLPAPHPARTFSIVLNGKAARMADRHATLYSHKGLLVKVHGLDGLADRLGVPAGNLRETFAEYNAAAEAGSDRFGRKVFPEGHWPIEPDEDFYVGQITPVIHYTMGGIAIDTEARVLRDADGTAIPGLYAIGEASGGVHGNNRLAGNSLLECTVFGRQVGLSLPIAAQAPPRPAQVGGQEPAPTQAEQPEQEQPEQAGVREITQEELAQHAGKEKGNWVALYGKVYELADYVEEHPGGEEAITDVAGIDGTEKFAAVHNIELLESMGFTPIGVLVD